MSGECRKLSTVECTVVTKARKKKKIVVYGSSEISDRLISCGGLVYYLAEMENAGGVLGTYSEAKVSR